MKKYWLRLFPDTFLWIKGEKALIYNAKEKKGCLKVELKNLVKIKLEELAKLNNLYSVSISEEDLKDSDLSELICRIEEMFSGELVMFENQKSKPISLIPLLNLQSDVKRLKLISPNKIGENALCNLHSLLIFFTKDIDKFNFDFIYKFEKNSQTNLLTSKYINKILKDVEWSTLSNIDVVIGNMYNIQGFDNFINRLDRLNLVKNFHIEFTSINNNMKLFDLLNYDQYFLTIHCNVIYNMDNVFSILNCNEKIREQLRWIFSVKSLEEFNKIESIIEKYKLSNCEIIPKYTENNLQFFEQNVFLTEEDFKNSDLSRKEVFINQALNINDFGKFIIMSNGDFFANPYFPAIGTVKDDIRELIYKELTEGQSWLRIRDMEPCCNCVYQWLCPSPSNYELALGRPNLCHVKQKGTPGILD